MGSFLWEYPPSTDICYTQYHNGRPLSIALTEPFESSEYDVHRQRSRSLGRRIQRQSFSIHHPNVQYQTYSFTPAHHASSGNVLVEKLETVTIEEQEHRPQAVGMVSYVRPCSPLVRQLKIRSRPSSSFNLHDRESIDQRWSKYVDEQHEETYHYHYHYPERMVPIQRASSSSLKTHAHDATTSTDDLHVPIVKPPIRPLTRDAGTTVNLPKRPLSKSETQILDRYEKDEKVRRDSVSLPDSSGPFQSALNDDDSFDFDMHRTSAQGSELFQRMNFHDGSAWRPSNALSFYSDYGRNDLIVRPTAKPREALVDTVSIVEPSTETIQTTTTTNQFLENSNRTSRRNMNFDPKSPHYHQRHLHRHH